MTDCLRGLERDGLVTREIYAQVPVRVEYSLTPLGWTITNAIVALSEWSKHHSRDVTRARNEYRLGSLAPAAVKIRSSFSFQAANPWHLA